MILKGFKLSSPGFSWQKPRWAKPETSVAVTSHSTGRPAPAIIVTAVIAAALSYFAGTAAENIQLVEEVNHKVTVYSVRPAVPSHLSIDTAADVALLMQYVEQLQAQSSSIAGQKALRNLGIPNKFVGVHGMVVKAATAIHGHVCRNSHIPRGVNLQIATICERICIQI